MHISKAEKCNRCILHFHMKRQRVCTALYWWNQKIEVHWKLFTIHFYATFIVLSSLLWAQHKALNTPDTSRYTSYPLATCIHKMCKSVNHWIQLACLWAISVKTQVELFITNCKNLNENCKMHQKDDQVTKMQITCKNRFLNNKTILKATYLLKHTEAQKYVEKITNSHIHLSG